MSYFTSKNKHCTSFFDRVITQRDPVTNCTRIINCFVVSRRAPFGIEWKYLGRSFASDLWMQFYVTLNALHSWPSQYWTSRRRRLTVQRKYIYLRQKSAVVACKKCPGKSVESNYSTVTKAGAKNKIQSRCHGVDKKTISHFLFRVISS